MRFENIILDILRVLPKSLLKLIAGPPLIIDGNQLDLNIQVVEKLSQKETKQTRITTHDYREAAKRFDLIGLPRVKKIKIEDIHKKISLLGHSTEKYEAPEEIYNSLPECCRYKTNQPH